ncbi:uncharacterized protein I206_100441 [Kwoniella pini CBS 10737]|uniref:SET domain-containing protein n=1 Tax=Kwoniella pini CBS 10737 TaxID=1296096 RepID=A0AAJ8KZ47_9TREE
MYVEFILTCAQASYPLTPYRNTHQTNKKGNIVPKEWLKLIEKSFVSFISKSSCHLGTKTEFDKSQIGLFRVTQADSITISDIEGIEFVGFALPNSVQDVAEAGFEPSFTFELHTHGREITLIGLGPARTINHSCNANVCWDFENKGLTYLTDGPLKDIGYIACPIKQEEGMIIRPGQELTAFYSEYFGE